MKHDSIRQIPVLAVYLLISIREIIADRPCAARQIPNRSVVCVCNVTYCDDVTRVVPRKGQYVTYTTSAAGARFKKGYGSISSNPSNYRGEYTIELDISKKYQKIKGFGGAVTDSSAINWKSLPEPAQQSLIDSYFGERGIEYNIVRVPIGSSDFSIRHYSYDDTPGDVNLTEFCLQHEDYKYKIPMLKKIIKKAISPVFVVGSSWSSPLWMKYTTDTNSLCGFLKREHYQTFANYLYKFIDSYEKEGIRIWAITTGNEPSIAHIAAFPIHNSYICLGWDNYNKANWIVNNLGPTIRNSEYSKVKILALDDQLYTIATVFNDVVNNNSKVLHFVDGIAVHYYADSYVSPKLLTQVTEKYPKLFLINTEASEGGTSSGVDLGSWSDVKIYINDVIRDLNHDLTGWMHWNLCLDTRGGPSVDNNFISSPIIVDAKNQEFMKQPVFYALGHISKFIPRGSVKIETRSPPCSCSIAHVAVLTPQNTIVVVLHNDGDDTSVTIKQGSKQANVNLASDSITTVEFLNKY